MGKVGKPDCYDFGKVFSFSECCLGDFFSAMAFKKVSIIPIIENGMSKEPEEIEPPTLTIYKYTPCSIKGFLFYLTTILAMIILGNQI